MKSSIRYSLRLGAIALIAFRYAFEDFATSDLPVRSNRKGTGK
jgi:hypothetical protein